MVIIFSESGYFFHRFWDRKFASLSSIKAWVKRLILAAITRYREAPDVTETRTSQTLEAGGEEVAVLQGISIQMENW